MDTANYKAAIQLTTIEVMREWLQGTPVWTLDQQIRIFGEEYRSYRMTWNQRLFSMEKMVAMFQERHAYIEEFGFAFPNAEALDLVASYAPLIEVGSGSGYWSRILQLCGVDIIATDAKLGPHQWPVSYCEIIHLQAKTAIRRWPDRNVFCSWASLNETWLRQAARAMRPGRILIAITEDAIADERTWNYIDCAFNELGKSLELLSWNSCHDRLCAWKKRARPKNPL